MGSLDQSGPPRSQVAAAPLEEIFMQHHDLAGPVNASRRNFPGFKQLKGVFLPILGQCQPDARNCNGFTLSSELENNFLDLIVPAR
jgi:hypothetical protein